MKIKDVIGETGREKNNNISGNAHRRLVGKLVFAVCIVFVLLLTYALGNFLFMSSEVPENNKNNAVVDPSVQFKDCKILNENCSNKADCDLYSFCGAGSYKICKIYDCASTYGVFTEDYEGNASAKRKAKPSEKDACGGSMQIVEQKCVNKKMQVTVKLDSEGDCKIGSFDLIYDTGSQPNKFVALKGGNYFITADTCGKITGIVPKLEDGVAIF